MPTWREKVEISDPWSFYDYKESFYNRGTGQLPTWAPPNWVGDHARRLAAYHLLDDYCKNRSRAWMSSDLDDEDRKDYREYGDPAMLVNNITSSIVGDSQTIKVEGLQDEADVGGPRTALQDTLNEWAQQERFYLKVLHNEKTAVKLGDCCYVIGWDAKNLRPRVRVYDPGFYFPVLDDWSHDEDYPRKVHIAWEYERPDTNGKKRSYLRRLTWWLAEGAPQSLPWNPLPATDHCWFEELEWVMDDVKAAVADLSDANALEVTPAQDLGIDFLPVIHIPNTINETEHYGDSSLGVVMQALDDLSSVTTDLQAAAATTGSPPLGLDDADVPRSEDGEITTYGPGQVFAGKVTLVDTSRSLDALLKLEESVQDRVATNARTPNTLTGRIDPEKVNSGIILTLSFQPHANMIREMRLVRKDKHDLLLKFVIRYMIQGGIVPAYYPTHLEYGSYLPSDRQEISSIVTAGMQNHSMSVQTAVDMMVQAGYPIEDAQMEVLLIQQQNFDAASKALDATGDINFSRSLLGLPPIEEDLLGGPETNGAGEVNVGDLTEAQIPPAPELPV